MKKALLVILICMEATRGILIIKKEIILVEDTKMYLMLFIENKIIKNNKRL